MVIPGFSAALTDLKISRQVCSIYLLKREDMTILSLVVNALSPMCKRVLITDFSGAVREEEILPEGLLNSLKATLQITTLNGSRKIEAELLDFRELEGTRCYCDPAAEEEIVRRLAPFRYGAEKWREFPIHFIDTGEYHYVSKFFVDAIDVPFTLLVFDNHTDMQEPAFGEGLLSCGSWLAEVMRSSKALQNILLAGPDGRITLYKRVSDGKGFAQSSCDELSVEGIKNICDKTSIDNLYISIDKDVMSPKDYYTNWSQGGLGLEELEAMVFAAMRSSFGGDGAAGTVANGPAADGLLGIDICGGLSSAQPALTCDLAQNRRTDLALLSALLTKVPLF